MRRVGNRVGKLSIVVVMLAAAGCGGGGGSKSSTTTTAGPAQTTTTVVSAATFAADLCKAGRSIADATPGAAGGYKLFADTYGKLVPTPEKKAPLAEFVAANRALQALWSGSTPTTTAAFSTKFADLTKNYNAAANEAAGRLPARAGADDNHDQAEGDPRERVSSTPSSTPPTAKACGGTRPLPAPRARR